MGEGNSHNKKYIGKELISDGYERWVCLAQDNPNRIIWAHYIDSDFTISNGPVKLDDKIIQGRISIDIVVNYENNESSGFEQPIVKSSHIIAHAKVIEILDDFSAMCQIDGFSHLLKVEFEKNILLQIGQNIKFVGSLEIEQQ